MHPLRYGSRHRLLTGFANILAGCLPLLRSGGQFPALAVVSLRCAAPVDVAVQRLLDRPHGLSDADPAIAARMAETADPWPEAITIDTSGPAEQAIAQGGEAARPHGIDDIWSRRPRLPPD